MNLIKSTIRQLAQQFGVDIIRHLPHKSANQFRSELFQRLSIDTVLDIGANTGQFAQDLRRDGWLGRIISFEPLPDAYEKLIFASAGDPNWVAYNSAIGNSAGVIDIHVAANSQSSSILDFQESFSSISADLEKIKTIKVPIGMLDSALEPIREKQDLGRIFLKLDVQGYEPHVIEGAASTLASVIAIQCELSFNVSYKGAINIVEMIDFLRHSGFALHHISNGWRNPNTNELYEVDGTFIRSIV